jgi:hypothetical protein
MRVHVVTPEKLLRVELAGAVATTLVVMDIRYVVAITANGERRVAIELEWDPQEQAPQGEYYCPEARVQRELTPPALVRRVHPYLP